VTSGRVTVVAALGVTQTVAWASRYYMPAILGAPIARALHLPTSVFFGLFSGALLLSAVVGPSVWSSSASMQVRTRLSPGGPGGRWIRTLGPPATVKL
jgi:hypothetical protein